MFGREGGGTSSIGAVRLRLCMLELSHLGNVEGFSTHSQFRNAASGLIGALRFAYGFRKLPPIYRDFLCSKIPPTLKLDVGVISVRESFSQIFQNTAN